jgi:hypothetical protein
MARPCEEAMNRTRFARTLDEAFPFGPEYGCAITRYERTDWGQIAVYVTCAIACLCLVAILAAEYLAADAASNNQEAANVAMKE